MIKRRALRSVAFGVLASFVGTLAMPLVACSAPTSEQAAESSSAISQGAVTLEMAPGEYTFFKATLAKPDGTTGHAIAWLEPYGDGFKLRYASDVSSYEDEQIFAAWDAAPAVQPTGFVRLADAADALLRLYQEYQTDVMLLAQVNAELEAVNARLAAYGGAPIITVDSYMGPEVPSFAAGPGDKQAKEEERRRKEEEERRRLEDEKKKRELELEKLRLENELKRIELEGKEKNKEIEAEKERNRLEAEKIKAEIEKMRLMLEKEFLESKVGRLIAKYGTKAGVVVTSGIATAIVWVVKLFGAK